MFAFLKSAVLYHSYSLGPPNNESLYIIIDVVDLNYKNEIRQQILKM